MMRFNKFLKAVILFMAVIIFCGMNSCKKPGLKEREDIILENILTRTSVRSYTDQRVDEGKIEYLLKAAMVAPTAVNSQPWSFVVITEKDLLKTLADSLPYAKMTYGAPLAIVACGVMDKTLKGGGKDYWVQDVSASVENILLAAHGMGLGAVWTGLYPIMERVHTVQNILHIPSDVIPLALIPIGYPDGETKPKNKWNIENVHHNRW